MPDFDATESAGLDVAAITADASHATRDLIERRRRLAWVICESERELGLEGCIAAHLDDDAAFSDRLDAVLLSASAGPGELDPRRYRVLWAIKNGGLAK